MSDRKMGARSNHQFGEDEVKETDRASEEAVGSQEQKSGDGGNAREEEKQAAMAASPAPEKPKPKGKGGRSKRAAGAPSRPLSAYNLFFKEQREIIIAERTAALGETTRRGKPKRAKISFEELAKLIGSRWKNIEEGELERFKAMAQEDAVRYKAEMDVYLRSQKQGEEKASPAPAMSESPQTPQSPAVFVNQQQQAGMASLQAIPLPNEPGAAERNAPSAVPQAQPDPMMSLVLGGVTGFLQRVQGPGGLSSQVQQLGPGQQQPMLDQVQLVNFGHQTQHQHQHLMPPSHQTTVYNNNPSTMPPPESYNIAGNNNFAAPAQTATQSQYNLHQQNQQQMHLTPRYLATPQAHHHHHQQQQQQQQQQPQQPGSYNLSQYAIGHPPYQPGPLQQQQSAPPNMQQFAMPSGGAGQYQGAASMQLPVPQSANTSTHHNVHLQQQQQQQQQQQNAQNQGQQRQQQHISQQVHQLPQQQQGFQPGSAAPSQAPSQAIAVAGAGGGANNVDASLIHMLGDTSFQQGNNANANGSSSGESSSPSWMNPRPIAPLAAPPKPPSPTMGGAPFEEQKLQDTSNHSSDSSSSSTNRSVA